MSSLPEAFRLVFAGHVLLYRVVRLEMVSGRLYEILDYDQLLYSIFKSRRRTRLLAGCTRREPRVGMLEFARTRTIPALVAFGPIPTRCATRWFRYDTGIVMLIVTFLWSFAALALLPEPAGELRRGQLPLSFPTCNGIRF